LLALFRLVAEMFTADAQKDLHSGVISVNHWVKVSNLWGLSLRVVLFLQH